MTTSLIVTEAVSLTPTKAPQLPAAPVAYDRGYSDSLTNILRQYFNTLDNYTGQLKIGALNGLALPQGAFHQDGVTTLTTTINISATTVVVASTADFQPTGVIHIGTEFITYTGRTSTSFTGCSRGQYGSIAASHTAGVYVSEGQSASAPAALFMSQTDTSNGVTLDATDKSKIRFETAGYYNIQFSAQLASYDNVVDNVTLWFSKNGTDIPNSAGIGTVPARVSVNRAGTAVISWNLIIPAAANDYIQLYFASDSGKTLALTYPPNTGVTHPASPSVILTATFTSAL